MPDPAESPLARFRDARAYRAALRVARGRVPRPWPERLDDRRVLLVLPTERGDLPAAWRFARALGLRPPHVLPVALASPSGDVPDAFAGAVLHVAEKDLDWRGLPRREVARAIWAYRSDVAVDLSRPFRAAAAYLVGGAAAPLRVGLHDPLAEPFYDLLFAAPDAPDAPEAYADAVDGLRRYLDALRPPVLPFRPPARVGRVGG